jgi:anti-sigma factor RsiW
MDCRAPDAIHEDDLVIYALDPAELSAEVRQHLAECPACAERAADYQRFAHTLSARLYRWECPTTQEISDYVAGFLSGKRKREISAHLRRCPRCAEEVEISRQFLTPTPALAPARPRLLAQLLPRRIAEAAGAGLRGGGDDEGWPRQYQADGISLSLHRAAAPVGGAGAMLLGLISRADPSSEDLTGVEVRLLAADTPDQPPLLVEQIDDLGNFVLSPVPSGRFDLLIALPEGDLVIERLELSG